MGRVITRAAAAEGIIKRRAWWVYDKLTRCVDSAFTPMPVSEAIERGLYHTNIINERIEFLMLKAAFPSCPHNPGKYEVKVNQMVTIFAAKYAARIFIQRVLDRRKWKWLSTTRIKCDGVVIECRHLERLMCYELSEEESLWQLPLPYSYYATSAHGVKYKGEVSSPQPSPKGDVGPREFAAELGIEPRKVRAKLRKLRLKLYWPASDFSSVVAQLMK